MRKRLDEIMATLLVFGFILCLIGFGAALAGAKHLYWILPYGGTMTGIGLIYVNLRENEQEDKKNGADRTAENGN